jgi:hypothetical protein
VNEHAPPSKFRRFRERKREGFREVRIWVPDLRSPQARELLARENAAIDGANMRGPTEDEAAWDRHNELEAASWNA